MAELSALINHIMVFAESQMDFYGTQESTGGSILPFIGFMLSVAGLVLAAVGATRYLCAKHEFRIFFDRRDIKGKKPVNRDKEIKIGRILMICGALSIVVSYVLL